MDVYNDYPDNHDITLITLPKSLTIKLSSEKMSQISQLLPNPSSKILIKLFSVKYSNCQKFD